MAKLVRIDQKSGKVKQSDYLEHVRKYLKRHFPETQFSLSIKRYKGGKSLRVTWTAGPDKSALVDLQTTYSGASFDHSRNKIKVDTILSLPDETIIAHWGFDFVILNHNP